MKKSEHITFPILHKSFGLSLFSVSSVNSASVSDSVEK